MTLGDEVIYDDGWKITDLRALRRDRIGFVFQAPYLIPFLDVTDNVALLPMLAGRPNARRARGRWNCSTALDVRHRAKAMPSQLSGGEQQRVAIARALANRPPVILADEPTAPLDSERALAVIRILNQMAPQYQTAIIVVTHDEKIIPTFKRIYHIRDGRAAAQVGQQGIHQQRDVLPPLAQGRHMQGQHAQAVIQVGPECPVAHHGGKIPMRGREDADIHLAGLVLAQPLDFPFLQHAQQFHLDIQRHLADLVQQQGAAMGGLEAPLARRRRAGEGAAGMAEQFGFQQLLGKGRAMHPQVGPLARLELSCRARATSSLPVPLSPGDEHARLARRGAQDLAEQFLHRRAVPHQPAQLQTLAGRLLESDLLAAVAQDHGIAGQVGVRRQLHGPHAQRDQLAVRPLHDEILDQLFPAYRRHERASALLLAIPGAGRALEQAGAEPVQDFVVAPAQHPSRRLVDGHDLAPPVEEKDAFLQVVEELRQTGQGDHRCVPMLFKVNAILTSRLNTRYEHALSDGNNLLIFME
jgi:putative ABC transport system ATP-binding protein